MQLKLRFDFRSVAAVITTSATLGSIVACCLVTAHSGWWFFASLASSVGVGLILLPKERGYFRLIALLCVLQGLAFSAAALLSPTFGAWFYSGLVLSVYQLIWGSAQAIHVRRSAG